MVALDPIVGVPVRAMPGRRQQLLQHGRVHRRLIGDDLSGRDLRRTDRPFEEAMGRLGVAPRGDEDVDDLPELVDGAVDVAPLTATFTYVSSTCQRSPTRCRQGRAASASSGVNRSTYR
jgi:hypothetical protein